MAFNGNCNLTIESATNTVYRDQHNQTINFHVGQVEQRRVERKEDGLELIDEYCKIPLGHIYKVKQTGSSDVQEWEWSDENGRLVSCKYIGKRTYYHAKVYGDDKVYTGVTYSGRDASKLWKEDFVKYSGSHDLDDSAMIWQLLGVNRSKVPALIFYDEWLPMAHFCSYAANFVTPMYAKLLAVGDFLFNAANRSYKCQRYLHCDPWDLWLNSQNSQFSCGPNGPLYQLERCPGDPHIVKDLCSTADMLQVDICIRFLSKPSLNLEELFLDNAAFSKVWKHDKCLIDIFDINHHCTWLNSSIFFKWSQSYGNSWNRTTAGTYIHNELLDFLGDLRFDTIYSGRERCQIARLAQGFVNRFDFPFDDPKLVGGMTRFSWTPNSRRWQSGQSEYKASLGTAHAKGGGYGQTWLSRAHHHFGCDPNGIEDCYYMTFSTEIDCPDLFGYKPDRQDDYTIYYLFVRPLTRLSEVEGWLKGEPFFWSLDENGTTQIPEPTRKQLSLPTVTPRESAHVILNSWPKSTYDAVYKWQVAKGFDPSTLDFAHSLGQSLFEDDRLAEESQLEEVIKEEPKKPTESESSNIVTVTTQSDFDESFVSRLTKLPWWQATEDIPAFG